MESYLIKKSSLKLKLVTNLEGRKLLLTPLQSARSGASKPPNTLHPHLRAPRPTSGLQTIIK